MNTPIVLMYQMDSSNLVKMCAIRDGLSTCNALSYLGTSELINLISLDWYLYLLCCCTCI